MLEHYRQEMEAIGPTEEQLERLKSALDQPPRQRRTVRTVLIAALVCVGLVGTVAASSQLFRTQITDTFVNVQSGGENLSGYTIRGDVTFFPLDALSEGVLEWAKRKDEHPLSESNTKFLDSWEEAETFLGIKLGKNRLFEENEFHGSIHCYDKMIEGNLHSFSKTLHTSIAFMSDGPNPASITVSGSCLFPTQIESEYGSDVCVSIDANVFTEEWPSFLEETSYLIQDTIDDLGLPRDADVLGSYLIDPEFEIVYDSYTTPSGIEVSLVTTIPAGDITEELLNKTTYRAYFIQNGILFSVETDSRDPNSQAPEILKQVLDAFEPF